MCAHEDYHFIIFGRTRRIWGEPLGDHWVANAKSHDGQDQKAQNRVMGMLATVSWVGFPLAERTPKRLTGGW